MKYLIFFVFAFLLVFLTYVLIINRKRKEYTAGKKFTEVNYIVNKFKLDMRKVKYKKLLWITTIANSFIVAATSTLVINVDGFVWQLLVGFVILLLLTFVIYEIIGRILKRKGKKDE